MAKKRREKSIGEYDIDDLRERRVPSGRQHLCYDTYEPGLAAKLMPWAQRNVLGLRRGSPLPSELERN